MNDELQSKMVEILANIQLAVGKTADFTMAQLPDVAHQYITYGRAITTALFFLGLLCIFVGFYLHRCINIADENASLKYEKDKEDSILKNLYCPPRSEYFRASDFSDVVRAAPFGFGLAIVVFTMPDLFRAWIAPKVFLLQGLSALLK